MKYMLFCLFIMIIIYIILFHRDKKEYLTLKENISSQTNLSPCDNVKTFSLSTGLLMDSKILCSFFQNISGFIPNIHIENTEIISQPRDWILVNLDHTQFKVRDGKLEYTDGPKNLLCKTRQCYDILSKLDVDNTYNIVYSGFTSMDKYNKYYRQNYSKFVHIAGKSPYKNTIQLVNIWKKYPEWSTLTILCREKHILSAIQKITDTTSNIDLIDTYVTNKKLSELYNNYGVHICLSAHEGFGHYIYEGMSSEAVVVYGNVPPTNEWFTHMENGIGVKMDSDGVVNTICPKYKINETDFVKKIKKIINMSSSSLEQIGKKARKTFLKQKKDYFTTMSKIFGDKNDIPKMIHSLWIDKSDMYKDVVFPQRYKPYKQTWIDNHKNYTFLYWSGETVLKLIHHMFPEYVEIYKKFPLMVKCDFARFVILYALGGVYIDMDISCRSNIDHLLTNDTYFVKESEEHTQTYRDHHDPSCEGLITNGFAGSVKHHPFVLGWIHQIVKNYNTIQNDSQVMDISGPHGLYKYYMNTSHDIFIGNVCSLSYINKDTLVVEKECKRTYNNPALIHWWNGTEWGAKVDDDTPIVKPFTRVQVNYSSVKDVMIWEENKPEPELEISKYIVDSLVDYPESYSCVCIGSNYGEISVPVSFLLQKLGNRNKVFSIDPDSNKCDFVEKMSLLNSLSNSCIIQKGISEEQSFFQPTSHSRYSGLERKWSKLSDIVLFNTLDSFHSSTIDNVRHLVVTTPQSSIFDVLNSSKKIIMLFQPKLILKYNCENDTCDELAEYLDYMTPPYRIEKRVGTFIICSPFLS